MSGCFVKTPRTAGNRNAGPAGSQATGQLRGGDGPAGTLRCLVTDDPMNFRSMALRVLGDEADPPIWVSPEELNDASPPAVEPMRVSA